MSITVKYFLNIEKIMGKKFDEFIFLKSQTLRELLEENVKQDKMEQIKKGSIIITRNGEGCKDLDIIVENEDVFCLCPAIYGG